MLFGLFLFLELFSILTPEHILRANKLLFACNSEPAPLLENINKTVQDTKEDVYILLSCKDGEIEIE